MDDRTQRQIGNSPGRHPRLELNLSVTDVVAELGGESGGSHGRQDRSGRRVRGPDTVSSGGIGRRTGLGEVERVAVGDLIVGKDVGSEGGDDVKGVVLDEGVGVVVGRPVEFAVSAGR